MDIYLEFEASFASYITNGVIGLCSLREREEEAISKKVIEECRKNILER